MPQGLITFVCVFLAAAAGGDLPAVQAQRREGRIPLTAPMIASALQMAGFGVTPAQLQVPGFLTAATATPKLQLSAVDLLPDGRLRVRLACEQASECVPFLVTVQGIGHPATGIAALQKTMARGAGDLSRGALLQAGQHTTLVMQSDHMLISLPVIAIDSGRPGTDIRVSSLDRKQIFRGVVTEEQTVRGTLP
jgi:hypothetical protein